MKAMSIYMRDETAAAVKRTAAAQGRSISNFITHNIQHALADAGTASNDQAEQDKTQADWIEQPATATAEPEPKKKRATKEKRAAAKHK